MARWGFGDPDTIGPGGNTGETDFDWGFGDPVPVGWDGSAGDTPDCGFGDPFFVILFEDQVQLFGDIALYPDEGGVIVTLITDWPIEGPYRVRLINSNDSTLVPADDFCYSAVPGQGTTIYTNKGLDTLKFGLPVAPPAIYHIRIDYGPGFGSQLVINDAIRITFRNRSRNTYQVRSNYPDPYKTGPVNQRIDPILE